jgi:spermidine synthase
MLTATALNQLSGEIILEKDLNGQTLQVIENSKFRWFTLGGNSVQAIMSKEQPQACLLAIPQTLLIFLLWQSNTKSILNLGLGAGSIERALTNYHSFTITAVEQQPEIIKMVRSHFGLPNDIIVYEDCAGSFLTRNRKKFDAILCDIYQYEQSPSILFTEDFYRNVSESLTSSGCALLNINIESEQQLKQLITTLTTLHLNLAFIDFNDYKNIIIILSKSSLPNKQQLKECNQQVINQLNIDFSPQIERMHVIPINL